MGKIVAALTTLFAIVTAAPLPLTAQTSSPDSKDYNPSYQSIVTAYFDTNYKGKGEFARQALARYDLVCVHIEAPDEAGHKGDAQEKIRALENIDRYIVAPILDALEKNYSAWRLLILPDHPTPCTIRTHTHERVPFVYCA